MSNKKSSDNNQIILDGTDGDFQRIVLDGTDSDSSDAEDNIRLEGGDSSDGVILNEDSDCKKLEENVKLCLNDTRKSECSDILEKFEKCKKN